MKSEQPIFVTIDPRPIGVKILALTENRHLVCKTQMRGDPKWEWALNQLLLGLAQWTRAKLWCAVLVADGAIDFDISFYGLSKSHLEKKSECLWIRAVSDSEFTSQSSFVYGRPFLSRTEMDWAFGSFYDWC